MVESFDTYHSGDPTRNLLDFAQQLSSFQPEKKVVAAKKAKVEKATSKPKSAVEAPRHEKLVVVNEAPERTAKAVRAPRARRGPVPQPFEAQQVEVAAVSQAPQAPVPQSAEDMEEHLSPEQYSDWMKYYRECAEYFEQCERNCAEQAGMEPPRRAGMGQSSSAPAPPRQTQAPSIPSPLDPGMAKASLDSPLPGSHSNWASLMPPPLPEGVAAQAPLLQALQALQLLQQQQQLQQLQIQSVQQLISGSLLGSSMLGMPLGANLQSLQSPVLGAGLNNETLMNLLMAWYYSGYYTGEYAARQGKM